MRLPTPLPLVLVLGLFAVVAACGGKIAPEGGEGTGSPSSSTSPSPSSSATTSPVATAQPGGSSGSPSDPFPVCPQHEPVAGTECGSDNLGCAYVNVETGVCSSVTCGSDGQWQVSTPAGC